MLLFQKGVRYVLLRTRGQKRENKLIEDYFTQNRCVNCTANQFDSYAKALMLFADTSSMLTDFGKAHLYYRITKELMLSDLEIDNKIYNWELYDKKHIQPKFINRGSKITRDTCYVKVLAGAFEIKSLLENTKELTNNEGKEFLDFLWLKYIYESSMFTLLEKITEEEARENRLLSDDDYFEHPTINLLDDFLIKYQSISVVQQAKPIIQDYSSIYKRTGFNPSEEHLLLTPSFNFNQSNSRGFGAELAIEIAEQRNPYRIFSREWNNDVYFRMSNAYIGFNQTLGNSKTEVYFGFSRISQGAFVYVNWLQFGWKHNIDPEKKIRWFYRPEAGYAFGNFQVFYSYTHMMRKHIRPLAEKHTLTLRITLPYLRIGHL